MEEERDPWALETGLPNDVDGWMVNCRFGTKDEYVQAVTVPEDQSTAGVIGLMFMADLVDASGELIGTQGWSVGSGWIPSDDGKSIHHPNRMNVVDATLYGQLQRRVMRELGVDMHQYGMPTDAPSWNGLGFHWMMEEHATIKGKEPKRGLMPDRFIDKRAIKAAAKVQPAVPVAQKAKAATGSAAAEQLKALAGASPDVKTFQKLALRIEGVTQDDTLMANVLDVGPTGFYAQNKG